MIITVPNGYNGDTVQLDTDKVIKEDRELICLRVAGSDSLFKWVRKSDTIIETGDTVHHTPSGEDWVVAYVQGNYLAWCGWPPGEAKLNDCTLLQKATPGARLKLLQEMANISGNDPRKRYAVQELAKQ